MPSRPPVDLIEPCGKRRADQRLRRGLTGGIPRCEDGVYGVIPSARCWLPWRSGGPVDPPWRQECPPHRALGCRAPSCTRWICTPGPLRRWKRTRLRPLTPPSLAIADNRIWRRGPRTIARPLRDSSPAGNGGGSADDTSQTLPPEASGPILRGKRVLRSSPARG